MTRVEDLESRLVGQETVFPTYWQDWACEACRRCGGVPFKASGYARDHLGRPAADETFEETERRLDFAHRHENSCSVRPGDPRFKIGLAWHVVTEDGKQVQKFLPKKHDWPPREPYSWPPWMK